MGGATVGRMGSRNENDRLISRSKSSGLLPTM